MSDPDKATAPQRSEPQKTSRYRVLGEGSTTTLSILSVAAMVALWWIATELAWVKPLFLPKPETIWFAFKQAVAGDLDNHTLWVHFLWSMYRVFAAFVLAVAIGIPVGIGMGVSRFARGIFDPPIEFYRPLPPLAYLPLMIIWFGIGEQAKIILLFLAIFAPVALAARAGVRSVPQEQIQAALSMGATRDQVVRYVIVPGALPEILVGLRIGMGVGWTTLVAAEMVAADAGLGKMVYNASNFLRTDVVILGILAIGCVAYVFELVMRMLERRLVPWKGRVLTVELICAPRGERAGAVEAFHRAAPPAFAAADADPGAQRHALAAAFFVHPGDAIELAIAVGERVRLGRADRRRAEKGREGCDIVTFRPPGTGAKARFLLAGLRLADQVGDQLGLVGRGAGAGAQQKQDTGKRRDRSTADCRLAHSTPLPRSTRRTLERDRRKWKCSVSTADPHLSPWEIAQDFSAAACGVASALAKRSRAGDGIRQPARASAHPSSPGGT